MNSNTFKIRVGIDVDGVLRDFTGQIKKLYKQATGKDIDTNKIEWGFMYKHTVDGDTIAHKVWTDQSWLEDVFLNAPILNEKTVEGYNLFCNSNFCDVYIVSAQKKGTENLTRQWLKKNGFDKHIDEIYTGKKLEAHCNVLIDDKYGNVFEYNNAKRMGILIDQPWNSDKFVPVRVANVYEAYKLLEKQYGN